MSVTATSLSFTVEGPPVAKQRARKGRTPTMTLGNATTTGTSGAFTITPGIMAPPVPVDSRGWREHLGRGRAVYYTPEETKLYERRVKSLAWERMLSLRLAILGGPVGLRIASFQPLTKAAEAAGRAPADFCVDAPDWDNVGKAISDALNGVAWADDRQVALVQMERRYAAISLEARVEVVVWSLSGEWH